MIGGKLNLQHLLQELGGDLVCVLDQLKIKLVLGLGEGAGANILARWDNTKDA